MSIVCKNGKLHTQKINKYIYNAIIYHGMTSVEMKRLPINEKMN